jgi:hypothetical protein
MSLDMEFPLCSVITVLRWTFEEFGIRALGTSVELMIPKGVFDKAFATKSTFPHFTS